MPKAGYITPSRFSDLMTAGRSKDKEFGDTAIAYAEELVLAEIGVHLPDIITDDIQWGWDNEAGAILKYQERTGDLVLPSSFTVSPELDYVGGTCDGLVGADGMVEVKCPKTKNHFANIWRRRFVKVYMYQVQGYMWIYGRAWCDLISFDPRVPEKYQLLACRIDRDDAIIDKLRSRIPKFKVLLEQLKGELDNGLNDMEKYE